MIKTFYAWPLGKTDENSPEYLSLFTFTIIRRCDDVKLFTSIIIPVSARQVIQCHVASCALNRL